MAEYVLQRYDIDDNSWRYRPGAGCDTCGLLLTYGFPDRQAKYETIAKEANTGCRGCRILKQAIEVTRREEEKSEDVSLQWESEEHRFLTLVVNGGPEVVEVYRSKNDASIQDHFSVGLGSHMLPKFNRESAVQQIQVWIEQCDREHSACYHQNQKPSAMPRRVLDLAVIDAEKSLKLIESNGVIAEYTSLSHCWGGYHPLTTTRSTIEERKSKITLFQLPRVFRQAVELSRGLGIRYLWIDSLCIIQGDADDWVTEAGKMASVYANSFLNIAAAGGRDSRGKLFAETEEEAKRNLQPTPLKGEWAERHGLYARRAVLDWKQRRAIPNGEPISYYAPSNIEARKNAPLLSRAWVLQERLLAPRNLFFHEQEMVLDCRSFVRCECNHINHKPALPKSGLHYNDGVFPYYLRPDLSTNTDVLAQWKNIIEEYSFLDITQKSDHLPALSGIATIFAPHLGGEYLAGLWKRELAKLILWEFLPQEGKMFRRAKPFVAPSWSWASVDTFALEVNNEGVSGYTAQATGPVTFFDTGRAHRDDSMEPDTRFRILSAHCDAMPGNCLGQVTSGHLVIEAAALTPRHFFTSWEEEFPWESSDDMTVGKVAKKDRWVSIAFRDLSRPEPACFPTDVTWFRLDITPEEDMGKDVPGEIEASDVRYLVLQREKERRFAYCLILGRHPIELGAGRGWALRVLRIRLRVEEMRRRLLTI